MISKVIQLLSRYRPLGVTPPRPPYRVIQWGTGAVGAEMITAIPDHRTDLDLVGVNAVPEVCDAAPGFATSASLPVGHSHTGFGHIQPTVSGQRDR